MTGDEGRMKTLVVEDDLALSDVIAFTMRRAGFEIITAYDGLTALGAWEQQRPDLLLLDLNLPKLDGLDVCRRIRLVDNTDYHAGPRWRQSGGERLGTGGQRLYCQAL